MSATKKRSRKNSSVKTIYFATIVVIKWNIYCRFNEWISWCLSRLSPENFCWNEWIERVKIGWVEKSTYLNFFSEINWICYNRRYQMKYLPSIWWMNFMVFVMTVTRELLLKWMNWTSKNWVSQKNATPKILQWNQLISLQLSL